MRLAILTALVAVAFVPGLPSASTAPRWAVLLIGIPLLLISGARILMTPAHWFGLAFVAFCGASLLWSPVPASTLGDLFHLLVLAGAFVLGAQASDREWGKVWDWLAIGVSVSAPIAIAQALGWDGVETVSRPPIAGLFLSKAFLAQAGMVALIPAIYRRRWWFVPGPLVCVVLPLARETIVVAAVVISLVLLARVRIRTAAAAIGALLCAVAFFLLVIDIQDFYRLESLNNRLVMWQFSLANLTPFGWGLGVYGDLLPIFEFAHNEPIHFAFELGIGSAFLWAAVIYSLGARIELERLVLVAILVMCCFTFPLHMPLTAFMAALVAGRLADHRYRGRRGEPDGGIDDRESAWRYGDAGGYPLPRPDRRGELLPV